MVMLVCFPLEGNILPYTAVCRTQSSGLKSFSCSETPQDESGLTTPQDDTLAKLCNDITSRIETRIKQQRQNLSEQRYVGQHVSNS